MNIMKKTVAYIAELSRLRIEEDEISEVTEKLGNILGYIRTINDTIDTGNIKYEVPMGEKSVVREDVVDVRFSRAELLDNCPEHTEYTPIVPKTVE